MMKTMAIELVGHGIRVNSISPGPTDTQQSVDLVGEEQMQRWREEGFPVVPMGRLGSPEDMAAAFSFLASPDSPGSYTFTVRQTYSDGSVVDWSGSGQV
jgi:NAD(P)-dependent dehydrogenase (short-subunit alcohol dehydrogenase family)